MKKQPQMQSNGSSGSQPLQISSFIKEPTSLKLLILAGTNIKPNELATISKCVNLIKLDLSNNYLQQLPIKFSQFVHLKILYLHENSLSSVQIKGSQLEYVSLFGNPIGIDKQSYGIGMGPNGYRKSIIQANPSILGIDFNVVTDRERAGCQGPLPIYSEIKWPIVQISSALQHEDDYLNLLKAEIFVINNIYKRTQKIQLIQSVFLSFTEQKRYNKQILRSPSMKILPSVIKAAEKWKKYTILRRKLRLILAKKGKQQLIYSRLERIKMQRSEGVHQVMEDFMKDVRNKMKVRAILERQSRSYRLWIPAQRNLEANYLGYTSGRDYIKNPVKLYFRQSQLDILSKACLYSKKLFFKQKDYDLCDQFSNLFCQTGKKYYLFRKPNYQEGEHSWLLNSIHNTADYVMREMGIDRRHLLYGRKGHKQIKVKNIKVGTNKLDIQEIKQKMRSCDKKLQYRYSKYDILLEHEVKSWKILNLLLKILRYINAGNANAIVSNQTAYFQTEVIFEDKEQEQANKQKIRIYFGLEFFVKRVVAANVIQRFWRKKLVQRNNTSIIGIIRKKRAEELISRWIRNLIFNHRLASIKTRSYYSSAYKSITEVYFHLDIYMSMPQPKNLLRYQQPLNPAQFKQPLSQLLSEEKTLPLKSNAFYMHFHKNTQIQICHFHGRKWLKITYPSAKECQEALIYLHKYTYRYRNRFYFKMWTQKQLMENGKDGKQMHDYQQNLYKIFGIQISKDHGDQKGVKTVLNVDNAQPYFIWSEVNSMEHFSKFQKHQKNNTNVSIFIYNKHKRPLKVSCQFYWIQSQSLYQNRKHRHQTQQLPLPQLQLYSYPHGQHKEKSLSAIRSGSPSAKNHSKLLINSQNSMLTDVHPNQNSSLLQFQLQYGIKNKNKKHANLFDFNNNNVNARHGNPFDKSMDRLTEKQKQRQKDKQRLRERDMAKLTLRRNSVGATGKSESVGKSYRAKVKGQQMLQKLSETLNIRGK